MLLFTDKVGFEEIAKERSQDLVCGPIEFNVNISVWGFKEMSTNLLIIQIQSIPAYPIWHLYVIGVKDEWSSI